MALSTSIVLFLFLRVKSCRTHFLDARTARARSSGATQWHRQYRSLLGSTAPGLAAVAGPRPAYDFSCSGTKTAGAKTRNDANYALAPRTRAIAALSSPP